MPFWTAVDGVTPDPKRVSRFRVRIDSLADSSNSYIWYAKSFTKPSAEITTTTHRYLNHHFNYPGSVKWGDVTIELIDPTDPIDAAGSLAQLLTAMGYEVPADGDDNLSFVNISKRKATTSLGNILVEEIDDGGGALETWTLQQAFVSKFEWGSLKYDGDDLNVLKLTVKYDWATCELTREDLTEISAQSSVSSEAANGKSYFAKS